MELLKKHRSELAIFILLLISGNPLFTGKFNILYALIIIIILYNTSIKQEFFKKLFPIILFFSIIFYFQQQVLGFVSVLGALRFILILSTGGLIIYHLKNDFPLAFFKVLYFISFIGLFFYFYDVITGGSMYNHSLITNGNVHSFIIYTPFIDIQLYRNCGMFWEPGAFSGIIALCFALNINNTTTIFREHKFKLFVLIFSLLSTQSTTGYISIFIIISYYFIFILRNKFIGISLIPIIILFFIYIYKNTDFLEEKINDQTETALDQGEDFSNTRFGSLLFDSYYIKKHPLIGNGMSEKTRYADHSFLQQRVMMGENLGNGNGFSNFLACMGVLSTLFYFIWIYKAAIKQKKKYAFLLLLVILINLQGEPWMNYPIYLSLMLLNFTNENSTDCDTNNML